jgi:hypothetical protein
MHTLLNTVANFLPGSPTQQAGAGNDDAAAAPEVVSLFQSLCLSTLSAFWVVLGLTARSCLCACLVLNTVANFLPGSPTQQAGAGNDDAAAAPEVVIPTAYYPALCSPTRA